MSNVGGFFGWLLCGVMFFIGLVVADEMGYIGDNDDPPAKTVKQALERAGNKLSIAGEKIIDGIKERKRLNHLERYMDQVKTQNDDLRELGRKIIAKRCRPTQKDCMAFYLTQYVANEIEYSLDGRGETDDISPWYKTYERKHGDCEDQTILLASLLENAGMNTLIFFAPRHVYPGVCLDRVPDRVYLADPFRYWRVDFQGKEQICLPLEPTKPNSKLGHAPRECFQAVYDPHTKERVRIRLKECN